MSMRAQSVACSDRGWIVIGSIERIDKLIHEPARLMIMMILDDVGEADFLYLLREAEFTQGNLSSHLSKLEQASYVEIEKKFKGKMPLL